MSMFHLIVLIISLVIIIPVIISCIYHIRYKELGKSIFFVIMIITLIYTTYDILLNKEFIMGIIL